MSQASQLAIDSPVRIIEFSQLASQPSTIGHFEKIVTTLGVVYVTSITRDGCSGCEEQNPLFKDLAARMATSHPGLVSFSNIHVRHSNTDVSQSPEAKEILRHAAYPTYAIHVRSKLGALEVYRAIYPSMENLEKQVEEALDLAEYYKTDAEKTK